MTNNIAPLILVVDDEAGFLEVMRARLEAKGFRTIAASDGNEATEKAKKFKPRVIIMDVQMPNQDGIAATISIHNDPETKNIPVLFLTNLGNESTSEINRKIMQDVGASGYFRKSDDYQPLIRKVEALALS